MEESLLLLLLLLPLLLLASLQGPKKKCLGGIKTLLDILDSPHGKRLFFISNPNISGRAFLLFLDDEMKNILEEAAFYRRSLLEQSSKASYRLCCLGQKSEPMGDPLSSKLRSYRCIKELYGRSCVGPP